MQGHTLPQRATAPLGSVEPHALMLNIPRDDQLLYKLMTPENLLRSIGGAYLHFNRIDSYTDFPCADTHDGQQTPTDQQRNVAAKFANAPQFSASDYYDQSRTRTYACCFSLENSQFIWKEYANGSRRGKVCVVFHFGKLRARLNQTLQPGNAVLDYQGLQCRQIFSVNYGIVQYVAWDEHQANTVHLPNPIAYTYLKDTKYSDEKELRITLSALGIGEFAMIDGSTMAFPTSLQASFDFRAAIADGAIERILCAPDTDSGFLYAELGKLGIAPREGSDPPSHKELGAHSLPGIER